MGKRQRRINEDDLRLAELALWFAIVMEHDFEDLNFEKIMSEQSSSSKRLSKKNKKGRR